jgi:uncharacterized membrane protein
MNWKEKLSSRKLWAAIVGVVMGVAMVFGLDESTITDVAGAVVSIVSLMTYIITEGKIDAAAAEKLVGIDKVIEIVNDESEEVGE